MEERVQPRDLRARERRNEALRDDRESGGGEQGEESLYSGEAIPSPPHPPSQTLPCPAVSTPAPELKIVQAAGLENRNLFFKKERYLYLQFILKSYLSRGRVRLSPA